MPYYSVRVAGGDDARKLANELKTTFNGKNADFTGHPFFYVKNHRNLADFTDLVEGLVHGDLEATVSKITKSKYDWD